MRVYKKGPCFFYFRSGYKYATADDDDSGYDEDEGETV